MALKQSLGSDNTCLAFVIGVPLSPLHEIHLADLLEPHVATPVARVTDTMPILPDNA
jgi:two-component system, chemotaxis family, CheB/CheR fusion protein